VRFAQQTERSIPFVIRGLVVLGFSGPDNDIRFESAQVAEAA